MLAKVHIARKALGLDDATYRAMLLNVAGVSSSKDLTPATAPKVLDHLRRCGWQDEPAKKHGRRPNSAAQKKALIGKVEALLAEARRPWAYAHAMAQRICKVEIIDWCDPVQLRKIIAALTYDARRHGRPEA